MFSYNSMTSRYAFVCTIGTSSRRRSFRISLPVGSAFFFFFCGSIFVLGMVVARLVSVSLENSYSPSSVQKLYKSWVVSLEKNKELSSSRALVEEELEELKARLVDLQGSSGGAALYEARLKEQVRQLEKVVRSAITMGFLDQRQKGVTASRNQEKASEGVGGAEISCVAMGISSSRCNEQQKYQTLLGASGAESDSLVMRLQDSIDALRALPIGVPVSGLVSSEFGIRASPFGHGERFHQGLDIALSQGSPVRSTGDGIVSAVRIDPTYGKVVDVRHSRAVVTRYAHLSRFAVGVGSAVRRGSVLGQVGSTGRSTGPHLHYEIRVWGIPQNPRKFFALTRRLEAFAALSHYLVKPSDVAH
jgi:murein DD-endopeptidase MepM/ murein hydrolase activator NlpD